ncbi:hypothetical protein, partial [Mesorhizobium sp. M4B.F.Ca.ET.214.01.1.1]|uniref:hypothetical protein n=1 Tax=Mesorhizobium sp. M4B.F.Ca.ET.214.01.1.1 TaxID=2563955 RepID=UPI0016722959
MEPFKHSSFLRLLAFPRMVGDFKYETSEKDLFFRLSDAKENHGSLISRALLDNVNKKFWIEAGVYRNIMDRNIPKAGRAAPAIAWVRCAIPAGSGSVSA